MADDEKKYFTLVFEGDIRAFKKNPLTTETPFGVAIVVGVGNAFEELDEARARLDFLGSERT